MKYDELVSIAEMISHGTKEERHRAISSVTSLDNEGLIDLLETSREVLFDNSGDEGLTKAVQQLIEFVNAEQSTRIVTGIFGSITKIFKK